MLDHSFQMLFINPATYSKGVNKATLVPPVGLLYIASLLNKKGFRSGLVDANLKNDSPLTTAEMVKAISPAVVGINVNYYNLKWTNEFIKHIRESNPDIIIGAGGHLPSYSPEHALKKTGADFAVKGEGEIPMLELAKNLAVKRPYFENVPVISIRTQGRVSTKSSSSYRIKNLDDLPFPDYDLVGGIMRYSQHSKFPPAAPILLTRGCAFRCSFCSNHVFGNEITFRSPENVVRELIELKQKYGIREVDILDDNFIVNRKYGEEILDAIIMSNVGLAFNLLCGVRIEHLDEDMVHKMKNAGYFKFALGIESADDTVLKLCNKKLDLNHLRKIVQCAKKSGFEITGFFIIGLPGETWASIRKTIQLARELKLHTANFSMATPYPGTALYDYILKHGKFLFDPHDNYDYGFFSNKVFYSLPGLEKEDVLFRFRYVYKKYYSLQRILGYFFRIKSFTELRWFFSAWKSVRDGWMRS